MMSLPYLHDLSFPINCNGLFRVDLEVQHRGSDNKYNKKNCNDIFLTFNLSPTHFLLFFLSHHEWADSWKLYLDLKVGVNFSLRSI